MSNRYSFLTQKTVSVTTLSTQVLPVNSHRAYLLIQNQGTDSVAILFGTVQTGLQGIILFPNSDYEPVTATTDSIYMIANSGTQNVFISEGQ